MCRNELGSFMSWALLSGLPYLLPPPEQWAFFSSVIQGLLARRFFYWRIWKVFDFCSLNMTAELWKYWTAFTAQIVKHCSSGTYSLVASVVERDNRLLRTMNLHLHWSEVDGLHWDVNICEAPESYITDSTVRNEIRSLLEFDSWMFWIAHIMKNNPYSLNWVERWWKWLKGTISICSYEIEQVMNINFLRKHKKKGTTIEKRMLRIESNGSPRTNWYIVSLQENTIWLADKFSIFHLEAQHVLKDWRKRGSSIYWFWAVRNFHIN